MGAKLMSQIEAHEPSEDLVSFEREFADDPDKAEWSEFGEEAKQTFDSPDKAIQGVSLSVRLHNLMQKNVQRLGDAYRRKNFVKRADLVLTAFHVPSSVKANQLIPIVWVMKLDQSIP